MEHGVARILLQGARARGARVLKFAGTKSFRSRLWWRWRSNFELARQKDKHGHSLNDCKICLHLQTPGGTCPSAPCPVTPLVWSKTGQARINARLISYWSGTLLAYCTRWHFYGTLRSVKVPELYGILLWVWRNGTTMANSADRKNFDNQENARAPDLYFDLILCYRILLVLWVLTSLTFF